MLSGLIPGAGQLYLRKYISGLAFLLLPIIVILIFPEIPIQFSYLTFIIISVADVYFVLQNIVGRKKALINLCFTIVIFVIIIPSAFYLFTLSMYKGGEYVINEHLNIIHTRDEMVEISNALNRHYIRNKEYPENFMAFVNRKPIWEMWAKDSWDNDYRYALTDVGYLLTSAGVDGVFDTDDDITRAN